MEAGDLVAGKYRLLRPIGEGGMSSVWAARHELIDRDVAIKITSAELAARHELRERFLHEARAAGKLRHPNIIDVIDVGELPDGSIFLALELLDGVSLADYLDRLRRLSQRQAVAISVEICRGLEVAHKAGIVHRDLKPGNIFLNRGAGGGTEVKILDFGISKSYDAEGVSLSMTQTGTVLGTPSYMSWEQAKGLEDIDHRSDLWSVGILLYEMVSGDVPFTGANYNATIDGIVNRAPPPLAERGVEAPPELEAIIGRCLAKQRRSRFQSAKELREALEALVSQLPAGDEPEVIKRVVGPLPSLLPPRGNAPPPEEVPATLDEPPSAATDVDESPLPPAMVVPMRGRKRLWVAASAGGALIVLAVLLLANRSSRPASNGTSAAVAEVAHPSDVEPVVAVTAEPPAAVVPDTPPIPSMSASAPRGSTPERAAKSAQPTSVESSGRPSPRPAASAPVTVTAATTSTPSPKPTPAVAPPQAKKPLTNVDNAGF